MNIKTFEQLNYKSEPLDHEFSAWLDLPQVKVWWTELTNQMQLLVKQINDEYGFGTQGLRIDIGIDSFEINFPNNINPDLTNYKLSFDPSIEINRKYCGICLEISSYDNNDMTSVYNCSTNIEQIKQVIIERFQL